RRAVAVIGTRRPSPHGLDWAKRLGIALAANGWPVLSGLAEGIDGAAHRGCLEAGGVPVGVLATSSGPTPGRPSNASAEACQAAARSPKLRSKSLMRCPPSPSTWAQVHHQRLRKAKF
ncbi:MAG: hypothetical protein EBV44_09055, partial [Synechococcaceae bacterium WB7_1B_046]|nr:hypothetical protein [Synechococcaceae bacterium WB7_1B_046]